MVHLRLCATNTNVVTLRSSALPLQFAELIYIHTHRMNCHVVCAATTLSTYTYMYVYVYVYTMTHLLCTRIAMSPYAAAALLLLSLQYAATGCRVSRAPLRVGFEWMRCFSCSTNRGHCVKKIWKITKHNTRDSNGVPSSSYSSLRRRRCSRNRDIKLKVSA